MLRGILVLVPLGVTAYVLALCYRVTAGHLAPFIQKYAVKIPEYAVEALSVVLFFALLYLLGLITAVVLGKRLISLGEAIINRIPLVKTIYAASRQVVALVSVDDSAPAYQAAVIVGFPNPDTKAFGFVTGKLHVEGEGEFYRVFVPTTPNPTSGYFEILPPELVQHTDLGVEAAVQAIMSAGIMVPDPIPIAAADNAASSGDARVAGNVAALDSKADPEKGARRAKGARGRVGVWARTKNLVRKRILSGFLALVPLAVTVFVMKFVYDLTAGKIVPLTRLLVGQMPNYLIALVSIALLLVSLYVTGYVGTMMLGSRLIRLVERIIERIPLATTVYGATKQIVETLLRQQEAGPSFQSPVVVEFPYPRARTIGFQLGSVQTSTGQEYIRVFVPTTPNVTVGLLELYEAHRVFTCDLSVEDALKMVVSGGMIGPASLKLTPLATAEWKEAQRRP
jgi:uncharacterized membrane protein